MIIKKQCIYCGSEFKIDLSRNIISPRYIEFIKHSDREIIECWCSYHFEDGFLPDYSYEFYQILEEDEAIKELKINILK